MIKTQTESQVGFGMSAQSTAPSRVRVCADSPVFMGTALPTHRAGNGFSINNGNPGTPAWSPPA